MTRSMGPLAVLLGVTVAAALVLEGSEALLGDAVMVAREREAKAVVFEVMTPAFDNDILMDRVPLAGLPQPEPAIVYRARRQGAPVGCVVMPVIANGYNGPVALAVGIARDGTLTGVRVVRHQETPGLGDQVDQHRTRWVDQFSGRSLADTPAAAWAVSRDGGRFDAISGATITPRGIVRAVHGLLEYYASDPDFFYR